MAGVAETYVVAAVPWADLRSAHPLLDLRTAAGGRYDARGLVLVSPRTLRLLRENLNPADLWGRRHGGPETFEHVFANDVLPVPCMDHHIPEGQAVIVQDGLPALTLDVGG